MILLPDIRFNTAVLSIQQPYTLNDYLVTRIVSRLSDYSYEKQYYIYNENNGVMTYRQSDFADHFYYYMRKFIQQYSPYAEIPGGRGVDWNEFTFEDYIRGIEDQCNQIQSNYQHLDALKYELQTQNRNYRNLRTFASSYSPISHEHSSAWNFTSTSSAFSHYNNQVFTIEQTTPVNINAITSWNHNQDLWTTQSIPKNIIHSHNYKPEYIPYYMPHEDRDTTLLLGAEIEVDCGGESGEHVKNVLEIICGKLEDIHSNCENNDNEDKIFIIPIVKVLSRHEKHKLKDGYLKESIVIVGIKDGTAVTESYNLSSVLPKLHCVVDENDEIIFLGNDENDIDKVMIKYDRKVIGKIYKNNKSSCKANEDKMYCTHDGSLKDGIEFDTMPMSLEYHKNKMNYKEMFEYLTENGYKAHDTDTCGLHIHADRKYLGKTSLMQQLTISKILYILEKFNDEICVIARRDNAYSRFVGKEEVNKNLNELYNKYKSTGKKVALNLLHENSIEFRCFKGTLKYETFILTLEFVQDIIDFAKAINIEEIELMQWEDLMNTFSDKLKEYYLNRLKKKQKESNSKENTAFSPSPASPIDIHGQNLLQTYIDRVTPPILSNITESVTNACALSTPNEMRHHIRENDSISNSTEPLRLNTNLTYYETIPLSHFAMIINEQERVMDIRKPKTSEEQLKEKIKIIKKKLKNNNNYIECKRLQTELNKLQKELKKEKKKKGTQ